MKRRDEGVDTGLVMGMLLGARGVGFVIGGPVSAALLDIGKQVSGNAGSGYSTQYGAVIIYTGITAVFGGWGWMWKTMRNVRV